MKKEKNGFWERKLFANLSVAEPYTGVELSERDRERVKKLVEQLKNKEEQYNCKTMDRGSCRRQLPRS